MSLLCKMITIILNVKKFTELCAIKKIYIQMKHSIKALSAVAVMALMLTACGGEEKTAPAPAPMETPSETPAEPAAPATETPAADAAVAEIVLNAGDDMKFDKTEIKVKAGQKVKLTLNHTGKMDKKVMGHNVVIIPSAMDIQMFAQVAIKATDSEYIPASEAKQIIAHTKLIGGGESTTIEFDAPESGSYKFLCTFPGHWAAMQGTFIVE